MYPCAPGDLCSTALWLSEDGRLVRIGTSDPAYRSPAGTTPRMLASEAGRREGGRKMMSWCGSPAYRISSPSAVLHVVLDSGPFEVERLELSAGDGMSTSSC